MRKTRQLTDTVTLVQGNLFDSPCDTLTNTINCAGAMGAGVAKGFKIRYPDMYQDYRQRCDRGEVQLGHPYLWISSYDGGKNVLNFPTKQHWKDGSQWPSIVAGLDFLHAHISQWPVRSLAVPALGCGYGGLEWDDIKFDLANRLHHLGVPVELFVPHG
jgi:O-acetyl-ADP-ribose deacetylase (regulator of RNase III)